MSLVLPAIGSIAYGLGDGAYTPPPGPDADTGGTGVIPLNTNGSNAIIGNDADTLLNMLSGFWRRFFRDIGDLQVAYEGTEVLLGQQYLNLLNDVLATSVVETPLFRKEFYRLIRIREDEIRFEVKDQYDVAGRFVYAGDGTRYGDIPRLQDLIWFPQSGLETTTDYDVDAATIRFVTDPTNPPPAGFARRSVTIGIGGAFTSATYTDWVAAGVKKGDTLYFSTYESLGSVDPWAPSTDFLGRLQKATIVKVTASTLFLERTAVPLTVAAGAGLSWRIVRERNDGSVDDSLPSDVAELGASAPFSDGVLASQATLDVDEVALWAVNAMVDDLTLYKNFGHFFTKERASSEAYRTLLRGLMQLYLMGPALERVESALSLTAGIDVVHTEGETLLGYTSGVVGAGTAGTILTGNYFQAELPTFDSSAVGGNLELREASEAQNTGTFRILEYVTPTTVLLAAPLGLIPDTMVGWRYSVTGVQEVTTDAGIYKYGLDVPVRDDVKDPANFGVLTFRAFETLTTAVTVSDYVLDPEWWHRISIPAELVPGKDAAWRRVEPRVFPTAFAADGSTEWRVGDPGLYVGATEIAGDPSTGEAVLKLTDTPLHRKASFVLMDRALKMHMFSVKVHASALTEALAFNDFVRLIRDVKPAHTYAYVRPGTEFTEAINLTDDEFWAGAVMRLPRETVEVVDSTWVIGAAPVWTVGDTWRWAAGTSATVELNPGSGGIPIAVGGANPLLLLDNVGDTSPGSEPDVRYIDRALYVNAHA